MKYNFRPMFGICRGFACDVGACKFVASGKLQLTNHITHTHGIDEEVDSSAVSTDEEDVAKELKTDIKTGVQELVPTKKSSVIPKLRKF